VESFSQCFWQVDDKISLPADLDPPRMADRSDAASVEEGTPSAEEPLFAPSPPSRCRSLRRSSSDLGDLPLDLVSLLCSCSLGPSAVVPQLAGRS